jgi:hypothetical protein
MTEKQALEAAKKQLGKSVLAETVAGGDKRLVFGRETITLVREVGGEPSESKEVREKISATADTWELALERLLTAASRCEKHFLEKPWPYY